MHVWQTSSTVELDNWSSAAPTVRAGFCNADDVKHSLQQQQKLASLGAAVAMTPSDAISMETTEAPAAAVAGTRFSRDHGQLGRHLCTVR